MISMLKQIARICVGIGNRGDGLARYVRYNITHMQLRNHLQLKSLAKICPCGLCVQPGHSRLFAAKLLSLSPLKGVPLQLMSKLLALRKKIILKAYELILSLLKLKMNEQLVCFAECQIKSIS